MITVEKAWALQGYSRYDHLIEDSRLAEIEGLSYRCVADSLRAACDRCFIGGTPSIPLRRHGAVGVRVRFKSGAVEERTTM